ncbi:hypothetical protein [Paraburkholderia haematera]|jgi:hypothetical protein|uniref:Uncharacterized protein n=1 Tax=Paraburkholderia haematera TaxID=2793077 RepID=A0ABM8R079_9BURK|nr:hypothetical protein [Paraburkholderia haematera]CAE6726090.1 hypothetical protein R69888_01846 [Paraburkholderia haematera]
MPLLEKVAVSERPRVVTVASIAHKRGRINFDDFQSTRRYRSSQLLEWRLCLVNLPSKSIWVEWPLSGDLGTSRELTRRA